MKNRIYIKDWLLIKPYDRHVATDNYYLKICNEVKNVITKSKYFFVIQRYIDKRIIDVFSCLLTSYFEDIISETNIWNSFVNIHKRLYKKPLPFYNVDEYYEEEINHQDVRFLIWYFLNRLQDDKYIEPINEFIYELADEIMEVFDKAWDDAPENDYLKTFYQINENEEDYYIARKLIDTILFETYLFIPDTLFRLKELELKILDRSDDDTDIVMLFNENRDRILHTSYTRLLSLKGKEWAAEILGKDHKLSKEYLKLSDRISGYFLYKGQDEEDISYEHIASGKIFNLTKKSIDYPEVFTNEDVIYHTGIARWKGEWWFSGVMVQKPYDANLILEEKNSVKSRADVAFLDHQEYEAEEVLLKQTEIFKEFNNGSQIAFLPSDEIENFSHEFINYYNDSLKLTKKQLKKARKRARKEGFFGTDKEEMDFSEVSESGLVFMNPKSGVELAFSVNSAFPSPDNPFYDEAQNEEHIIRLLISEDFSKELVMYCIDNYKTKIPFFNTGIGKQFIENTDFLLRYWKTDTYHTKPMIAYTGSK